MSQQELETRLNDVSREAIEVPEPKVVFLCQNGTEEIERVVSYSSLVASVEKVKKDQSELEKRRWKKKTGFGKPYSSTERRQLLAQINDAKKEIARRKAILCEQVKWLLLSPGENPLTVRLKSRGEAELVSGKPLETAEAAWRMFVFREAPEIWLNPNFDLVGEFFLLRRDVSLQMETQSGEAQRRLEEFISKKAGLIPSDLNYVLSKISQFNFRRPLLPGLGTLEKRG